MKKVAEFTAAIVILYFSLGPTDPTEMVYICHVDYVLESMLNHRTLHAPVKLEFMHHDHMISMHIVSAIWYTEYNVCAYLAAAATHLIPIG